MAIEIVYDALDKVMHCKRHPERQGTGNTRCFGTLEPNLACRQEAEDGVCGMSESVTGGVPQVLLLGLQLIGTYINDLDKNICGLISTVADDTQSGGVVGDKHDCVRMEWNIDQLENWAEQWELEVNP